MADYGVYLGMEGECELERERGREGNGKGGKGRKGAIGERREGREREG